MDKLTNEQLATAIQSGETDLIGVLWERTEKLIKLIITKCVCVQTLPNYIDIEDLFQGGFFGLLKAVKAYDRSRGFKFTTYLDFNVKNAVADTIGRKKQIKALSYNTTVQSEDGETEVIEFVKDDTAEDYFKRVELTDTQRIVAEAVEELPSREKEVIKLYYFDNATFAAIGKLKGYSTENARRIRNEGLKKLRFNKRLRSLYLSDRRERKTISTVGNYIYSPEYFEAIRRLHRLERNEIQSI